MWKNKQKRKKSICWNRVRRQKLGIIGLGSIGAMVANDAYRLGMEVVGYDPYVSVDTAWTISRRVKRANDIAEVFSTCDFITVHVPLMENTHHLVGEAELAKMKPTTKLFNFSRKEIVDTDAVLRALKADRLAGYTTDFADEQLLHNEKSSSCRI